MKKNNRKVNIGASVMDYSSSAEICLMDEIRNCNIIWWGPNVWRSNNYNIDGENKGNYVVVRFLHSTWSDKIAGDISENDRIGNSELLLLQKTNYFKLTQKSQI